MDKTYDRNASIDYIKSNEAVAVIPSKSNHKKPLEFNVDIYKERHTIECAFGWLKYFRRIFPDQINSKHGPLTNSPSPHQSSDYDI